MAGAVANAREPLVPGAWDGSPTERLANPDADDHGPCRMQVKKNQWSEY